jgi:acyl-CoA thioesterase FadM
MKGLARRNTHVKYESPTTYQSNVMTKVKILEKKAKLQGQRSEGQMKGLPRRNTHVKYERPTAYQSKVMTKVKVLEKKAKLQGQKVKVMVSNERSWQKEYTCEI